MKLEQLKNKIGVYAFFESGVCLYVGKADCLKSRITNHLGKRGTIESIKIWDLSPEVEEMNYEETKAYLKYCEAWFINDLEPIENIVRPKISIDYVLKLPIKVSRKIINRMSIQ